MTFHLYYATMHRALEVCGTDSLALIEIVKNGFTVCRYQGNDELGRAIALNIRFSYCWFLTAVVVVLYLSV